MLSGIILFIAPSGRVARDLNWRILGLDKEGWEAVHTVIGYISIIFAGFHLILNRRFLINYLRNRARQFRLRPEFVLALILVALLSLGSALNWTPFKNLMDWGESLSAGWKARPVSLQEENTQTRETDATAATVLNPSFSSGGWGRYTVTEICSQPGIDVTEDLAHLAAYGIEAEASFTIRSLADTSQYLPSEIEEGQGL